jgi:hypothetical protein
MWPDTHMSEPPPHPSQCSKKCTLFSPIYRDIYTIHIYEHILYIRKENHSGYKYAHPSRRNTMRSWRLPFLFVWGSVTPIIASAATAAAVTGAAADGCGSARLLRRPASPDRPLFLRRWLGWRLLLVLLLLSVWCWIAAPEIRRAQEHLPGTEKIAHLRSHSAGVTARRESPEREIEV